MKLNKIKYELLNNIRHQQLNPRPHQKTQVQNQIR